jgi:formate/nitrite transporter FocA (FNT family)/predicted DsbA family dithiol-disulfide isomerase
MARSTPTERPPPTELDPTRDHVRGDPEAPVTLVMYGDFDCPHCGDVYPVVQQLREALGDELAVVYRHFPLEEIHPRAIQAAEAKEAAAEQGAFWAMHDRLYEHQDELAFEELVDHARALSLDVDRFREDLEQRRHRDRVHADFDAGLETGVHSAPTFFINGDLYEGPNRFEAMRAAIATRSPGAAAVGAGAAVDGGPSAGIREAIDRSKSGAPAAGEAVRDRFSADEIFQRIVATADEEFARSNRLLFLSGLAAGLSITLSFVGAATLGAAVPANLARPIGYLLYPLGFLFIVMGGYQLFTENTFTPVTLVLTRIASLPALLRVWGVVFTANILGAAGGGYLLANTGVFGPEAAAVAADLAHHVLDLSWSELFWKGVIAGWLVAGLVWLTHAARSATARVLLIFTIIYTVGVAGLAHSVIGSAEVLYLVFQGEVTIARFLSGFLVPATLGNTVGGVVLVALVNYSHTRERRFPDRDCRVLELGWREWLTGNHMGQPIVPTFPAKGEEKDEEMPRAEA